MHVIRTLLLYLVLLPGMVTPAEAAAGAHDPPVQGMTTGGADGGDVLRPARAGGAYTWFLGFDAGLTYSMFGNGPLSYYSPNPYVPYFPLSATFDEGNGFGFILGAAADFPLSDIFGIAPRISYNTRSGSSTYSVYPVPAVIIDPGGNYEVNSTMEDNIDWTFSHISIDLLLRIQLLKESLYLKAGPALSAILSNKAELTQNITKPDGVYYFEDMNGELIIVHNYRTASSSGEVEGFESSRLDLLIGIGTWIPLTKDLLLTPELMYALPLSQIAKDAYVDDLVGHTDASSAVYQRSIPYIQNNRDFNMSSFLLTVGLRWRIN